MTAACELHEIAEQLRRQLRAARTTVRVDPSRNYPIAAEALAPGVPSMADESTIDQGAAATVRWVRRHRRVLCVEDALDTPLPPPGPMISVYGLRAFMIAPLELGDTFAGTVSVHVNGHPRHWTEADQTALREAASAAASALRTERDPTGGQLCPATRAVRHTTT